MCAHITLLFLFIVLSIKWPPIDSRSMQNVEIYVGLLLITITNSAVAVTSVYICMLALFSLIELSRLFHNSAFQQLSARINL